MSEEWSDEIVALQSIYEDIDVLSDKCIEINLKAEALEAKLRVEIAADYPQTCPNVSVQAFSLQRDEKSALIEELEDMFSSGEPIVFEWAEKVRGKVQSRYISPFSLFLSEKYYFPASKFVFSNSRHANPGIIFIF